MLGFSSKSCTSHDQIMAKTNTTYKIIIIIMFISRTILRMKCNILILMIVLYNQYVYSGYTIRLFKSA